MDSCLEQYRKSNVSFAQAINKIKQRDNVFKDSEWPSANTKEIVVNILSDERHMALYTVQGGEQFNA